MSVSVAVSVLASVLAAVARPIAAAAVVVALLAGCGVPAPADPPVVRTPRAADPGAGAPPPPTGTRDDELSYLPVPLSVEDARRVLAEAEIFAPWGIGERGPGDPAPRERGRPMQALAITVLQEQADAAAEFEAVFARAGAPGKLLALCGLRAIDERRFERLARGMTASTLPVADGRGDTDIPGSNWTVGHAVTEIRLGRECLEIAGRGEIAAAAFGDAKTQVVWRPSQGDAMTCHGGRDLRIEVLRDGTEVWRHVVALCQVRRGDPMVRPGPSTLPIAIGASPAAERRPAGAPVLAGTLHVAGTSPGGLPLRVSPAAAGAGAPAWRDVTFEASAYDESRVALGGGFEIRTTPVWDISRERRLLSPSREDHARRLLSPSGQHRAFVVAEAAEPRVDVVDVRGTTRSFSLTPASSEPYEVVEARWSDDSRHLVFTAVNSGGHQPWRVLAVVYSAETGRFVQLDETCEGVVASPDFALTPDGRLTAKIWRTPVGEEQEAVIRLDALAGRCRASFRALQRGE